MNIIRVSKTEDFLTFSINEEGLPLLYGEIRLLMKKYKCIRQRSSLHSAVRPSWRILLPEEEAKTVLNEILICLKEEKQFDVTLDYKQVDV